MIDWLSKLYQVLILVLVEHTLGADESGDPVKAINVLILVLVEHTLGALSGITRFESWQGLNPCFSGTYSRSLQGGRVCTIGCVLILVLVEHTLGGPLKRRSLIGPGVLILVLVEHTLGVVCTMPNEIRKGVLILVLVEHTLGVGMECRDLQNRRVLILVLVEHTLGEFEIPETEMPEVSLNPCFSGTYSRSQSND